MKSLINAFKDALAASGLLLDLTPEYIFVCISIALLCGLVIYAVYRIFYRGSCYSENFNLLLLLTTLITTFIIMTISANIVLSLGMVGSLSIIRFRSAVQFLFQIITMRQQIQNRYPLPCSLASIPGDFKDHRTGKTIIRKLQFTGAFSMEFVPVVNFHICIGTDTF